MKLYIWRGGVTVVIIVGVAEAMPDSRAFVCSKKQVAVWVLQPYLFVWVGDVQAGYDESWSGMGGPCMMAYTEIGFDVGYVWGLRMQNLPGVGYKEGYSNS